MKGNKMKTLNNNRYESWSNYETFRVQKDLFSNVDMQTINDDLTEVDHCLHKYAGVLADYAYLDACTGNNKKANAYARAFMSRVDFYEIAVHLANVYHANRSGTPYDKEAWQASQDKIIAQQAGWNKYAN